MPNCQTCTNPTKHPIGFWDGENSHGQIFDCHNLECELKQNRIKKDDLSEENKKKVIAENEANGIEMDVIKATRKELRITIYEMAKALGVSCSDYSNYEQCREVLPEDAANRIIAILKTAITVSKVARRIV